MTSKYRITAGKVCDIDNARQDETLWEDWIFVDIGFAPPNNKSCGVAVGKCKAKKVAFSKLVEIVINEVEKPNKRSKQLNLLLEAPLSMAFDLAGNPTARRFELGDETNGAQGKAGRFGNLLASKKRGWYAQAGASTRGGAERLLWSLNRCKRQRMVRLFEGFAPVKEPNHDKVANRLREVVRGQTHCPILSSHELLVDSTREHLWPIPGISGWDSTEPPAISNIPPVVWVPRKCYAKAKKKNFKPGNCLCAELQH